MLHTHKTNPSISTDRQKNTVLSKIVVALLAAVVIALAGIVLANALPGFPAVFFRVIQEGTAVASLLLIPGLLIGAMANQVWKRFR